jgi:hypothetical protein
VTRPPGAREQGPIVSVPETLCADLIEIRPRGVDSLSVHIGEPIRNGDRPGAIPSRRLPRR